MRPTRRPIRCFQPASSRQSTVDDLALTTLALWRVKKACIGHDARRRHVAMRTDGQRRPHRRCLAASRSRACRSMSTNRTCVVEPGMWCSMISIAQLAKIYGPVGFRLMCRPRRAQPSAAWPATIPAAAARCAMARCATTRCLHRCGCWRMDTTDAFWRDRRRDDRQAPSRRSFNDTLTASSADREAEEIAARFPQRAAAGWRLQSRCADTAQQLPIQSSRMCWLVRKAHSPSRLQVELKLWPIIRNSARRRSAISAIVLRAAMEATQHLVTLEADRDRTRRCAR